jgi:U4/U6.U5 tri-snRNP-associated protein 2
VVRTGELVRKLWSPHQFRPHISPHELLQAIVDTSDKRFQITQQSFVIDLLTWYLNTLHARLAGPPMKKNRNPQSIVTECFQVRCVALWCVVLRCGVLWRGVACLGACRAQCTC